MSDFFDSVLQFFQSIGDFIHMIFDSFNSFTDIISTIVPSFQTDLLNYIPAFARGAIMVLLGILIVKAVLDLV